jgi:hypothetical protein
MKQQLGWEIANKKNLFNGVFDTETASGRFPG